MLRPSPASSMQKTYDECYLICSTAVYFEKQNNEDEALKSWRSALDQIYYHNAYKIPASYRPKTETEKALQESLHDMELQCKERVDLLDALRKSRADAQQPSQSLLSPSPYASRNNSVTTIQTQGDRLTSGLNDTGVPTVNYSDLARPATNSSTSRPPYLPARSQQNDIERSTSAPQPSEPLLVRPPPDKNLLSAGPAVAQPRRGSKTPSPERKGGKLKMTLRAAGRESTRSSQQRALPTTMRSRKPEAAKAATLAWTPPQHTQPAPSAISNAALHNGSSVSLNVSSRNPSLEEPRPSSSGNPQGSYEHIRPPSPSDYLPRATHSHNYSPTRQPPSYSDATSKRPSSPLIDLADQPPAVPPHSPHRIPPPVPSRSHGKPLAPPTASSPLVTSGPLPPPSAPTMPSLPAVIPPAPEFPSYRKEYLPPSMSAGVQAMRVRPTGDSSPQPAESPNSGRPLVRRPGPIPAKPADTQSGANGLARSARVGATRAAAPGRPSKPPSNISNGMNRANVAEQPADDANIDDEEENERDDWDKRVDYLLKHLPRGVDDTAAKNILNEIVIKGDEVRWDDVAGLDIAKTALKEAVVYPFLRPDLFMGLREPARGMLLFGPPGTGKTMLARAVATESRSTFFAISASSLTSKFLGESEKLVRALFSLAKVLAPSIIFVDEIDSLLSSRGGGQGEHEATRRIKTEFLIQWSDLQKAAAGREQSDKDKAQGDATRVLVLAATNLPWAIDEAARRRFVRRQYIPLPEAHVRKDQLRRLISAQKHDLDDRDIQRLVTLTDGFSGSDITALAKDAAMGPLRSLGEDLLHMSPDQIRPIAFQDFKASLVNIRPSVSRQGLKEYETWAKEFGERGG